MVKEMYVLPDEAIISKIYVIRGKKVMIDRFLAELYNVETRVLNQAVRRNEKRFPEDFMFQMTKEEMDDWISQIVISNTEKMGLRKLPLVFTEQGVAMLSSVLNIFPHKISSCITIDWYDYWAWMYDPSIARFTSVDPLSNNFPLWTPYHYVHNNNNKPLNMIDPTGKRGSV